MNLADFFNLNEANFRGRDPQIDAIKDEKKREDAFKAKYRMSHLAFRVYDRMKLNLEHAQRAEMLSRKFITEWIGNPRAQNALVSLKERCRRARISDCKFYVRTIFENIPVFILYEIKESAGHPVGNIVPKTIYMKEWVNDAPVFEENLQPAQKPDKVKTSLSPKQVSQEIIDQLNKLFSGEVWANLEMLLQDPSLLQWEGVGNPIVDNFLEEAAKSQNPKQFIAATIQKNKSSPKILKGIQMRLNSFFVAAKKSYGINEARFIRLSSFFSRF